MIIKIFTNKLEVIGQVFIRPMALKIWQITLFCESMIKSTLKE